MFGQKYELFCVSLSIFDYFNSDILIFIDGYVLLIPYVALFRV